MKTIDLDFVHRWEPADMSASGKAAGKAAATLLLLHGTGGSEHDLIDLGKSLLPEANLLSPRGKVSENGMARFFARLAEGVFDLPDLHRRTDELAAFIDSAAKTYGFDRNRTVAVGYSNGANIAASLLLSKRGALAGAVLFHPMVPFEPEAGLDLTGVPVFIAAGSQDPLVPPASTERLAELLSAGGAVVETRWQDGGHRISHAEVETARAWISKGEHPWN